MYYTREQHKRFLDKELTAISEEYLQKLQTKATALLSKNEVYVTQFVKLNQSLDLDSGSSVVTKQSGQFILRFKKGNYSAIIGRYRICQFIKPQIRLESHDKKFCCASWLFQRPNEVRGKRPPRSLNETCRSSSV